MDYAVTDPKAIKSLSDTYRRLGWWGFWAQVVIGVIPLGLLVYLFMFTRSAISPRAGLAAIEYLSVASTLVLVFTTFWFYRHTQLAKRIEDPSRCPSYRTLLRAAWMGIFASGLGILFSMLIMTIEVAHLLFYFLTTPQAGVQVVQTTANDTASWVSAVDMLSLLALIACLFVELIVLGFGLWLLLRTSISAAKHSEIFSEPVESVTS